MTTIRKIVTSKVDGNSADTNDTNEIRPFGEIAVYLNTEPNPDKLTLMMFDGTRTHLKSMVLAPGRLYGSDADSGDGNGRDTIKLIPDASLSDYTGNDQYLIIDPTGGEPGHIHIRAGGVQDQSTADLYLGAEQTFVRVSDTTNNVVIRTSTLGVGVTPHTWTFDNTGNLTLPNDSEIRADGSNLEVGGMTNFNVEALGVANIYTNDGAHQWQFGDDGNLTLPAGGDILDSNGSSVLGGGTSADTNIWVETFASDTLGDNVTGATSVEYDPDGNVVVLFSHDDTNNSERYISVAKFDTSGNKLWQQRFAFGQFSDGWGLAVDSTAIYVAGELNGIGSPAEYQTSSLMKLNTANGNIIWMKSYDFEDESNSTVVDVASDGNPVMVGYVYSVGQAFVTTTKVDKDTGNIVWSRKLDGQNGEYSYGMAVGPSGEIVVIGYMDNIGVINAASTLYTDPVSNPNWTAGAGIFISGEFSCTVSFVDGVPTFTNIVDILGNRSVDGIIGTISGESFGGVTGVDDMILKVGSVTAGDEYDKMLVVKYDSAGSIQWQKAIQFDAGFDCSGADADIDSSGNIYICGTYTRPDGAGPWSTAMSLLKMDGNGVKQWSRRVVGDCQDVATSVVVGPDNCLYLSGVTGNNATSDYTFVIAKYSTSGSVLWQRLLDNTTTWTFGSNWFSAGGGSNIAVKSGYVAVSGTFGDPGPSADTAFIAQISSSGTLFTTGDWDFKGSSFSGILNNTASDITVTNAGKTDSDNSGNIITATQTPTTDNSNFLVPTKYVLSTPIGDLTVVGNKLQGTGDAYGGNGLNLAPGPNLAADMYFRIHGGDNPVHLHLSTGNPSVYDQYFGTDDKYLKLGENGVVSIGTNSNTWTFGTDGNLALPGTVVNSTVTKNVSTTGTVLSVLASPSADPLWPDGSYLVTYGVDGMIQVIIAGNSIVTVEVVTPSSLTNWAVGDSLGTVDGNASLNGGPSIVLTVDSITPNPTPLDLTKAVNKLTSGSYTLADGVEGQIMNLVTQNGATPANVGVTVATYRIGGGTGTNGLLYPFRIFNDANASYVDSQAFCTLIFTDGAWQQSGGSWN